MREGGKIARESATFMIDAEKQRRRRQDVREGVMPTGNEKHPARDLMPERVLRVIRGMD